MSSRTHNITIPWLVGRLRQLCLSGAPERCVACSTKQGGEEGVDWCGKPRVRVHHNLTVESGA